MNEQKKNGVIGITLMGGFVAILVLLFSPIVKNETPINFLDNLYNSISKGSVYYIPAMKADAAKIADQTLKVSLNFENEAMVPLVKKVFDKAGVKYSVDGKSIKIDDKIGSLMDKALADADDLFKNNGSAVKARYDMNEKVVLYGWWQVFKQTIKELNKAEEFKAAQIINVVNNKAIECAYNYYGVEAQDISDKSMLVVLSLVFYVVYTLWLGYAILYLLSYWGFRLEH